MRLILGMEIKTLVEADELSFKTTGIRRRTAFLGCLSAEIFARNSAQQPEWK
jgi:hypothetical protein